MHKVYVEQRAVYLFITILEADKITHIFVENFNNASDF